MRYKGPKGVCDRCSGEYYLSELEPDGENTSLRVCKNCYDPYHPQNNVRVKPDVLSVPNPRPWPTEIGESDDPDKLDTANEIGRIMS